MSVLQVDRRRGDLFNYLIFLRVTPILPNIFINIASPVVDVPLRPFVLGALNVQCCCTMSYETSLPSTQKAFTSRPRCRTAVHWHVTCTAGLCCKKSVDLLKGFASKVTGVSYLTSHLVCVQPRFWAACPTTSWLSTLAASWASSNPLLICTTTRLSWQVW